VQAKRLLACAAQGFEHSHGADLGRLRALKGENCAEYALYARLHLLQGIVAYLSGTAIVLLMRLACNINIAALTDLLHANSVSTVPITCNPGVSNKLCLLNWRLVSASNCTYCSTSPH
jgi:hypothetical protein